MWSHTAPIQQFTNTFPRKKKYRVRPKKVTWITILTSHYQSGNVTPARKLSPRLAQTMPVTPERVFRPFTGTNISFNQEEMRLLEPTPEFQETMRLYRSPSILQQLQNNILEREQDKVQIKQEKKEEKKPIKQTIEKSDSFISINLDDDYYYNTDDTPEEVEQPVIEQIFELGEDNSVKYLKNSVWNHCHERDNPYSSMKLRKLNGKIIPTTFGPVIDLVPTQGQRKVRDAIDDNSVEGDSLNGFSKDQILTAQQKIEEKNIQQEMATTYCGHKLRNYIEGNGISAPKFLDDLDFSKSAANPKIKVKIPRVPSRNSRQGLN